MLFDRRLPRLAIAGEPVVSGSVVASPWAILLHNSSTPPPPPPIFRACIRLGGCVMTLSRRRAPLTLLLIGVALLAALLLIPWAVHAQSNSTAPTNLTAEVVDGGIALSWDAPTEDADSVTGYEVLRRRPRQGENSLSTYVADTGSATTTYTDTNATEPGERYVYRVKALRVGEKSGQSNYVRVDLPESEPEPASTPEPTPAPTPEPTPAPTPQTSTPDSPTGLTASSVSHDSVTLSWDDPDDDSITGYRVLRRSRDGDAHGDGEGSAEFVAVIDDTGSPAASYTDTSVTARTRYVYRVKAINAVGLSEQSSYLNVETLAEPVTTTVVVVPPEEPEEPEFALQQQVTIIDRGTLTVDPRLPTRGTIGSPGERHRYEVELQSGRFYDLYIREGSTGEIRLLDHLGDPVQDNGRDLVSAPHAAWGGGYLFYQPTTGGTYVVEVRASDDQQTGFYALMVRDGTITASSGDEGRSNSTDFKQFINRAKLHPGDPVIGILDTNGDIHGTLIDEDFFEANLHAGQTYTFTFAAGRITGGTNRKLWIAVHGPGTYHNFNNFSPPTSWGGSRTLSITITPHRTGPYVFTIGVFDSVIDRSAGTYVVLDAAITPYTVTLAEQ